MSCSKTLTPCWVAFLIFIFASPKRIIFSLPFLHALTTDFLPPDIDLRGLLHGILLLSTLATYFLLSLLNDLNPKLAAMLAYIPYVIHSGHFSRFSNPLCIISCIPPRGIKFATRIKKNYCPQFIFINCLSMRPLPSFPS